MATGQSLRLKEYDNDVADIKEAARYLKMSPRSLERLIRQGKFTAADGLRRVLDRWLIHMPTLRQRFAEATLMQGENNGQA